MSGTYTKLLELEKQKPEPEKSRKPTSESNNTPSTEAKVKKETNKSTNKDINKEKNKEIKKSTFLEFAEPALDEKPTQPQHYNYPPFVVELLENLMHDLKVEERKQTKRPKWRPTKTTVFILAVLFVVWDYRQNKNESILHKAIFENR